jgi:hypothetical protein
VIFILDSGYGTFPVIQLILVVVARVGSEVTDERPNFLFILDLILVSIEGVTNLHHVR